jgi:hypothetical protein
VSRARLWPLCERASSNCRNGKHSVCYGRWRGAASGAQRCECDCHAAASVLITVDNGRVTRTPAWNRREELSRCVSTIIEPGGLLGAANQELARMVKAWLERSGQPHSGVILIGLMRDGFELQYMGSEQLDSTMLEDRMLWIARQIQRERLEEAANVTPT